MPVTEHSTAANDGMAIYWKAFTERQLKQDIKFQYALYIPKSKYDITPIDVTQGIIQQSRPPTQSRASASRPMPTDSLNFARQSNPGATDLTTAQMRRTLVSVCLATDRRTDMTHDEDEMYQDEGEFTQTADTSLPRAQPPLSSTRDGERIPEVEGSHMVSDVREDERDWEEQTPVDDDDMDWDEEDAHRPENASGALQSPPTFYMPGHPLCPTTPKTLPTPRIELSRARAVLTALMPNTGLNQTNIGPKSYEGPNASEQSTYATEESMDAMEESTEKSTEHIRYTPVNIQAMRAHLLAQLMEATANGDDIDGNLERTAITFDRQHVLVALTGGIWRSEYTFDEVIAITKDQEDAEWEAAWWTAIRLNSQSLTNDRMT